MTDINLDPFTQPDIEQRRGVDVPRPKREWVSSATPEARKEIARAVHAWLQAVPNRDDVLREHYARGVDVRDLHKLVLEAGGDISLSHVKRIVAGARDSWKQAE